MYTTFTSIEKELRAQLEGDVLFDMPTRDAYSTALCMYKVMPIGVVAPRHTEDVQRVVRFCNESGVAVIPRGGGTGLVGQAVGMGIILDFSKYMKRIISTSDARLTAEAGCTVAAINDELRKSGTYYPIDPQSFKNCTLGGNIATNAAGAHGLKYGTTKDQVQDLSLILSDGDNALLSHVEEDNRLSVGSQHIIATTRSVLETNSTLIAAHRPKVSKNSSGYNIFDAYRGGNFDGVSLLCGSEGTLGVITEATVRVHPLPKATVMALAYCDSYDRTAEATLVAMGFSPAAIELLDRSYTDLGKGLSPTIDSFIGREFQSLLVIEFEGDSTAELRSTATRLEGSLRRNNLLLGWDILKTDEQRNGIWTLREEVAARLNMLPGTMRKVSVVEDGVVPVHSLPRYLEGLKSILASHGIPFTLYGHAGSGNIHCSTFVDIETQTGRAKIERAAGEIFDLSISLGGSLSGEHGDGFVRTPFLERAFGTEIYQIFRTIKEIFDPRSILNPLKIIGKQDGMFLHDIRYA